MLLQIASSFGVYFFEIHLCCTIKPVKLRQLYYILTLYLCFCGITHISFTLSLFLYVINVIQLWYLYYVKCLHIACPFLSYSIHVSYFFFLLSWALIPCRWMELCRGVHTVASGSALCSLVSIPIQVHFYELFFILTQKWLILLNSQWDI